jgi:hypothetical protein
MNATLQSMRAILRGFEADCYYVQVRMPVRRRKRIKLLKRAARATVFRGTGRSVRQGAIRTAWLMAKRVAPFDRVWDAETMTYGPALY